MESWNTPLFNKLKEYAESHPVSFHMPGHKLGLGMPEDFKKQWAALDVTEIPGMDHLHYPEGIIAKAQNLLAEAYEADQSFFLINGSTVGILSAVLTVCKPGDALIVARDCHKAVIHGMILAGVKPLYIEPEWDGKWGIPLGVTAEKVKTAIHLHGEAVGVLLTRPNYFGCCGKVKEIAQVLHKRNKVLLVDEAHGAHLKFHELLPEDALSLGADVVVQSAHKTLPSLTQSAFLHLKSPRIPVERLKTYLSMLQTSSPSYLLMASMDLARGKMVAEGQKLLDQLLGWVDDFKRKMTSVEKIKVLSFSDRTEFHLDPTRIVIHVRELGITGFEAEKILREKHGIQVEMSDLFNLVCIATISDDTTSFDKLYHALTSLSIEFKNQEPLADICYTTLSVPQQVLPLDAAVSYPWETTPLAEAVDRIGVEMVTPYPPGIPVICPGERIKKEALRYIQAVLSAGGRVNGVGNNGEIKVAKDLKK